MDDDLLFGAPQTAPLPTENTVVTEENPETTDAFGDDLAEYLAAEVNEAAAAEQSAENNEGENAGDDLTAGIGASDPATTLGDVPTLPDGRPITSLTKKQAKAELDKKEYKSWKKAMKAFGGAEGSDDEGNNNADSGKEKKSKSERKEKKEKKDKKHKKRDRHDGEDIDALAAELEALAGDGEALEGAKRRRREKVKARHVTMDADDAFAQDRQHRTRRGSNAANSHSASTAAKLSKAERERVNFANAQLLVQKMAEARASDAAALNKSKKGGSIGTTPAPIARLLLRDEVLNFGRKVDNEVPLVKAGFLTEIAHWILDGASGELAPLDLRDVAYELLLRFGFKGSMNVTHPNRVVDREDLNAWNGIGKEELETTILGKAVNTSRQHVGETARNRQRAVTLLQRLSKAFSGGDEDDADSDDGGRRGRRNTGGAVPSVGPLAVRWPCERDSSILTPFEYISNATEVFQGKVAQVDPLDPESYLRVPPLRIRKTPIR